MKYKKLLVLITCLLFITVAVFCFASAFKVTDVELKVTSINGSNENIEGLVKDYLEEYEGKNLTFVKKDKIKSDISSLSGYIEVVSVEKNFPNKIAVEVKEKREVFAINLGSDYYALDKSFCVLAKKNDLKNNVTSENNLLIKLSLSDYDSSLVVGNVLSTYDNSLLTMLKSASSLLETYKNSLEYVEFTLKKEGLEYKTIVLKMKEGVSFTLLKADEQTVLKLTATHDFYVALENKGVGEYITVLKADGNISITQ